MPSLSGGGAEKVLIDVLKYTDYSKYDVDLCLIINRGVYLDEIPSFVNRKNGGSLMCINRLFPLYS